jgi:hypothetical protein
MKQTLEVVEAQGNTTRLTVSPTLVTVKTVKDMSDARRKQLMAFVDYVVEQFVIIDQTWRGAVKFETEGVLLVTTSLKPDNPKMSNRRYECAV